MVKYELLNAIRQSPLSSLKACHILGLNSDRFYRWKKLYQNGGLKGLLDKPPLAKQVIGRLLPEEEEAIFRSAQDHPEQHFREIKFNLEKEEVYLSASTVYRRLKEKKLIKEHKILKPPKVWVKPGATAPHQRWLVDLSYIPIGGSFWYLIVIIDLYSRYVVGWELSPSATARDIKRILDFALAEWDLHEEETKPVLHSDNGPQMKAKSLKKFLRGLGVLNEYSRPHVPQDLAVLERLFRTTKQEEVYRNEYGTPLEARECLSVFFDYYNHRRPHQGIGNVTPYDRLTGCDEEIIQMRKIKSQLAQETRKLQNRICKNTSETGEIDVPVYTNNLNFFLERV